MKGLLIILLLGLSACTTLPKPFLYEAKKPSNSMYLFGTIHLGVPIDDVPMVVMDKFYQSQRINLEIDTGNYETQKQFTKEYERTETEFYAILNSLHKNNPDAADRLGKRLKLDYLSNNKPLPNTEKKLSQRLTPRAWNYTRAYFKQMDLETLEKISPRSVARFIAEFQDKTVEAPRGWFARMDPKFSMDLELLARARNQGKDVYALDDSEVLSERCSDLSVSNRIEGLFENKPAQSLVEEFNNLEKAYRSGDPDVVMKAEFKGSPELKTCMLDERNQKWIPRIVYDAEGAAMRGQAPLFVAVGTAHLFGPQGLLELLKKEGYSIQRIEE